MDAFRTYKRQEEKRRKICDPVSFKSNERKNPYERVFINTLEILREDAVHDVTEELVRSVERRKRKHAMLEDDMSETDSVEVCVDALEDIADLIEVVEPVLLGLEQQTSVKVNAEINHCERYEELELVYDEKEEKRNKLFEVITIADGDDTKTQLHRSGSLLRTLPRRRW